ncbi:MULTISPECIES: hypothetical protein [Pectobacterium]|uniref:hypothetical protein n=1 Tax=Pectobacterium TaxID=122277 RepID=UPI0015F0F2C5|nr:MULTISPECIES: hypothetical protein [Pectobacterium]MBA5237045.1 hypothetical protein [Pectobacterium aroidearum]QPI44475.1 hypothetical protein I2D83_07855 [Pectobacterium aroidearum]
MKKIMEYALEESPLFSGTRFLFLGEAIHGVSEFSRLRMEIAECYFRNLAVLIFEADSSGMLFSHQHNEDASSRLENFPRIMRTQEMRNFLTWAISRKIPCLGIDCIPRRSLTEFPREWHSTRMRETDDYLKAKSSQTFFEWRDIRMANQLIKLASCYPEYRMLIMLHNLHIKRFGSQETRDLRLKSVREYFEDFFPQQSNSIAQLARGGTALHNDLTPFSFKINDPFSLENYSGAANCILLTESKIPDACITWHHAFERETITPKKQYEGCFIFKEVHPPTLV